MNKNFLRELREDFREGYLGRNRETNRKPVYRKDGSDAGAQAQLPPGAYATPPREARERMVD